MCGIAGYIGREKIDPKRIDRCLSIMGRRGPDHREYYHHQYRPNDNVYLLHSRLSIIDLDERSNQPFRRGPNVLVNNGELYNYLELKNELKIQGQNFSTTSDTEVLLAVISQYGWKDALDKCEGMWAFALYNEETGNLLLGRDRFGEKPLYLYKEQSGFYFGSEVKFICCLLGKKLNINLNHIYRYIVNGYKSLYKTKETFFEGVWELDPSSVLQINKLNEISIDKYWYPKYLPDESISYQDVISRVKEKLIESVKYRLRADVPLAFCMSGGIDSNSLISIAKRICKYDVHGFTIMNEDERYEEKDMVEYSTKELGIRHTKIPVNTENFIFNLRNLVNYHDAPVYTITYYAQWLLMESIAKHGYRISISGTAADELFTGYYDHHLAYLYEIKDNHDRLESSVKNWKKYIYPLVRNPYLRNSELFIKNPEFRDHIYLDAKKFSKYLKNEWNEKFDETKYTSSLLRNRMLNEMFNESVPVILHEDDLNAMYFSIENRSPFLDRELFELCYQIPSFYLIKNGFGKAVLRDAMKGIVPEKILENRRKVGFNAPIYSFLDVNDKNVRSFLLDNSLIFNYIKRDKIENMLNKKSLPNSESKFIFYFINSKIFMEEFN